ncbi:MAG: tetratricopeptide repeat protein, partial [Okeania sp. SIO3B3]|nr:tetratricopeptide repeat protein [Okeania sp. SIO3B3]
AIEHYQQALTLFEQIGGRLGTLHCLVALGGIYHAQPNYQIAQAYYEQALPLAVALPVASELVSHIRQSLADISKM